MNPPNVIPRCVNAKNAARDIINPPTNADANAERTLWMYHAILIPIDLQILRIAWIENTNLHSVSFVAKNPTTGETTTTTKNQSKKQQQQNTFNKNKLRTNQE